MAWILIGIALAFVWWLLVQSKKPYDHRHLTQDRFAWLLRTLAETMQEGSLLVVEHQGSGRFRQFVQSSSPKGSRLGFAFPDAPWSRRCFEGLREALKRSEVPFSISETGDERVPRFIEVEFTGTSKEQVARATHVASLACEAMGLSRDERFTAHFRGELDGRSVVESSLRGIRDARRERS